jgi:hypothetical protein
LAAQFETLGNATIQVFQDGWPVLATDPWLLGTCYFGSWALDHPLTAQQIENVANSDNVWISHGHPDHLHEPSLNLLAKGKRILLPNHYDDHIRDYLRGRRFEVTVLPYRQWFRLGPKLRVMCMDNMNQDGILVIEAGDALLLNLNDSPVAGEVGFLRGIVARHPNDKTYLFAMCSVDADMFNFVDQQGRSLVRPPEVRKPPEVWRVGRMAKRLGVRNFCCSSSQHIYARSDSAWANPHRITWHDMRRHWNQPEVRLVPPFATVDLADGKVTQNHPTHQPNPGQFGSTTGEDDWDAPLTDAEWRTVADFFGRFELLRRHMNFLEISVGGQTRRLEIGERRRRASRQRGARFVVPRRSLMEAVATGYFDDLLIGNFMRVSLSNMRLYPIFTPLVAKVGGNAQVYTRTQYGRFLARYFRRNPVGSLAYMLDFYVTFMLLPTLGRMARALRLHPQLERLYHLALGDCVKHRAPAARSGQDISEHDE